MPVFRHFLASIALAACALSAHAATDVNTATVAELDGLKGVGPATSRLILAERNNGLYRSWDDFIARVKGIGPNRAVALSNEGLTVGGASYRTNSDAQRALDKAKSVGSKIADKAEEIARKTGRTLSAP